MNPAAVTIATGVTCSNSCRFGYRCEKIDLLSRFACIAPGDKSVLDVETWGAAIRAMCDGYLGDQINDPESSSGAAQCQPKDIPIVTMGFKAYSN